MGWAYDFFNRLGSKMESTDVRGGACPAVAANSSIFDSSSSILRPFVYRGSQQKRPGLVAGPNLEGPFKLGHPRLSSRGEYGPPLWQVK